MKFSADVLQYLMGQKFSNGMFIPISEPESGIMSRFKFIEDLVSGKKVIHVGCCDHIPLIEKKISSNTWMHSRITNSANKCIGIDNNKEGINYLKEKLSIKDVYCIDITEQLLPEISNSKWDYLILGEILEHIDNPVQFLQKISELHKDYVKNIVITVPNAFAMVNLKYLKKGQEIINTDHRYWFTPYTLAKVLHQAGYKIEYFQFAQEFSIHITWKKILKIIPFIKMLSENKILKSNPALRDTLIMVASLK